MMKDTTMSERRYIKSEFEVRSASTGKPVISGYAAMFNKRSQPLGHFVEEIRSGAFKRHLGSTPDVRAYYNHDRNLILARTTNGSLKLSEDAEGLHYEMEPLGTTYGRDLMMALERGDVNQSSFGFRNPKADWSITEDGTHLRSLTELILLDVSPVSEPAYLDTSSEVQLRDYEAFLASLAETEATESVEEVFEEVVDESRSLSVFKHKLFLVEQAK